MSGRLHDGNCFKSCWYKGVDGDNRDSVEKTGQNRTFPDIEVMQIAYGGNDEEDRRRNSERELRGGCWNVRERSEETGQNRTFPDIGVMQIAYGGDDGEERLKAELRT